MCLVLGNESKRINSFQNDLTETYTPYYPISPTFPSYARLLENLLGYCYGVKMILKGLMMELYPK